MTENSMALQSHDRSASFFFLWIGPGSLTGRPLCAGCRRPFPFSQQRTTQNEHRPQKLDRRHGLLQEQRGEEQCRNRFHIAQKRHGMCGDVLHSGKIQEIGKAGVDRAQNKKCRDLMFLRDRQPCGEKDLTLPLDLSRGSVKTEEERQEKALLPYPPMGDFFYAIPAGFIQFVRKQKHF